MFNRIMCSDLIYHKKAGTISLTFNIYKLTYYSGSMFIDFSKNPIPFFFYIFLFIFQFPDNFYFLSSGS